MSGLLQLGPQTDCAPTLPEISWVGETMLIESSPERVSTEFSRNLLSIAEAF